jgi:hypothetical protein
MIGTFLDRINMKHNSIIAAIASISALFCSAATHAQNAFSAGRIIPSNPTSTQSITYFLAGDISCARSLQRYKSISMVNNNITITFAEKLPTGNDQIVLLPPWSVINDTIDLGRLPPGEYTLSTVDAPCKRNGILLGADLNKLPFKVSEGRPKNNAFTPTIDYSGHWWDENDPGWGLFIWHDEANNLVAAWFTYTSDGKPAWYVFQPTWRQQDLTTTADVWQTSKPPGTSSPPSGATKLTTVGTARLGFYFGVNDLVLNSKAGELYGVLFFKLGDSASQTRTLTRFSAK